MINKTNLVDKYKPNNINELVINNKEKIKNLLSNDELPNMIIHSKDYGNGIKSLVNIIKKKFILHKSNEPTIIEFNCSNQEFQLKLEEYKKTIFDMQTIDTNKRLVIFENFETLNENLMKSISNIIDKQSVKNIFLILTHDFENIIAPIRNNLYSIDLSNPSKEEILQRLMFILQKEKIQYNEENLNKVITSYGTNIKGMINYIQWNKEDLIDKDLVLKKKESSNIVKSKNINNSILVDNLDFNVIYKKYQNKYEEWVKTLNLDLNTKRKHINKCRKIFLEDNIKTVRKYQKYLKTQKINTKDSFKKFVVFCDLNEIITSNQFVIVESILSKIPNKKSKYDDTCPTYDEMEKSLQIIKEVIKNPITDVRKRKIEEIDLLLYILSIESGVRWKSIEREFLKSFDESKLLIDNDVAVYDIRKEDMDENNKKNALYLFCRTKTMNKILDYYKKNKNYLLNEVLNDYKRTLDRQTNGKIVDFKYHRKYGSNLMDDLGINEKKADFIQSRLSGQVRFKHYIYKLKCIPEFRKLIPHWEKLIDGK